eukprot:SAG11_NODE_8023_length_1068_cov_2.489164_1_plen_82_part_00
MGRANWLVQSRCGGWGKEIKMVDQALDAALRTRSSDAEPLAAALGGSLSRLLGTALTPMQTAVDTLAREMDRFSARMDAVS